MLIKIIFNQTLFKRENRKVYPHPLPEKWIRITLPFSAMLSSMQVLIAVGWIWFIVASSPPGRRNFRRPTSIINISGKAVRSCQHGMSTNLPCSKTMLAPTCFFCFSLRLLYSGSAWQHWLCCVFLPSSPGAGRQYQKPPESRHSGKNRATIEPRGRCRSCGGGRERLGRERQDPPTRWRRCRSDDPPQGIPRGPKSNQQKMRLDEKFFVNLETEVGRLFLWDPQLLNHQNGRKNQSIKREMSRGRWTLLTCSLSCPWSSPCVWHSRAPCCSPTSKRFPLKAGIII